MKRKTILIVEDDEQIMNFFRFILENDGYSYLEAKDGESALAILQTEQVDMIVLDLGLPDIDGMDIIMHVRRTSDIPIVVVSARDEQQEKVDALDRGADDYLTKPFSGKEFSARVRVAFRHADTTGEALHDREVYQVGDLKMDTDKHTVFLEGKKLHLTPLEYQLLHLFFRNAGKVLTTYNILKEVYGIYSGTDTQALRALVKSLRKKIERDTKKPRYIITEIGIGYRMMDK